MNNTFKVSISIDETANLIHKTVVDSITGVLLDKYEINASGNKQCIVMVFDKYYSRVGNRLTLTVTIDNFEDYTRVHYVSGGGQGIIYL